MNKNFLKFNSRFLCLSHNKVDNSLIADWYITGFSDGEASFTVTIKRKKDLSGWIVEPSFQIQVHERDAALLYKIKSFFGVGEVYLKSSGAVAYIVRSIRDLNRIILHFGNYPLQTQKKADFLLFKSIIELMISGSHLTIEGLTKIVSIKSCLNKGLNDELKQSFNIIPMERPSIEYSVIPDPNWVAGFVDAEGCFFIAVYKSAASKTGYGVRLELIITQHTRDHLLIKKLAEFLGCGYITLYKDKTWLQLTVTRFSDIYNIIIPLFTKFPLHGTKHFDFTDFVKAAELMKNKLHLTLEGLDEIKKIKSGMNRGR